MNQPSSPSPPYAALPLPRILEILETTRTIAMVGASARPERPSWQVMSFLIRTGFTVVPVNPVLAGQTLLDQTVYPDLAAIPGEIDMVDVFRPSDACPAIASEAVAIGAGTLWLQEGVISDEAAGIALAAGLDVIMDRCPKKDIEAHPARWPSV